MEAQTPHIPLLLLLAGGAAAVFCGSLLVALFMLFLRPRRKPVAKDYDDLTVDVAALQVQGVPSGGPRLEFYGTPVRLVVLVLAPAGRGAILPPKDALRDMVEELIPGLGAVVDLHRPVFRRWPQQLSSQGFTQSFFTNIPLPGDRGKQTPWCAAAGKFESGGRQFLAGVVCRADTPNSLSQVVVQHHGQWYDVLRVKPAST